LKARVILRLLWVAGVAMMSYVMPVVIHLSLYFGWWVANSALACALAGWNTTKL
jgi:hypothetical protein